MKKIYLFTIASCLAFIGFGQEANDCNEAVQGCSTPEFEIFPPNPLTNNFDFGSGTPSNPSSNPNPGNSGCLLSGETSSTFITITIVSNGTLEWSIEGPNGGCFDWIMWPYIYPTGTGVSPTCAMLQNGTQPPVACNWNVPCEGLTGMGDMPPGGEPGNFEDALNVTAGQTFLLCLSNYSGTSQDVSLDFTGSAQVVCGVSAPDQTICLGSSTNVTIATPGLLNPTFEWLVTNGVSNTTGGTNVTVSPTVTTTYMVEVSQAESASTVAFVDTAIFTITVVPPPAPNAGPDMVVCFGSPFQLHGVPSSATNTANWQMIVPPGMSPPATAVFSPNLNNMNPMVTVNQPGVYRFILRESNVPCGMVRDTVVVTVQQLVVTAAITHPSCGGYADGAVTLTCAGANEYSFDNGGTWQTSPTMNGLAAGPYSVCARSSAGCVRCINITLTDPVPVIMTLSNDITICQNGTGILDATATGGTSFTFNWNHTASTDGHQEVTPIADTWYPVFATNENGCNSETDSIHVTVREPISAVITPDQNVCPGYPGTITATATGGLGAPYTYTWSTSEVHSGPSSTVSPAPNTTTTYTVTIEDACESTPFVISTQLVALPVPVPTFTVVEPVLCEPALFVLNNTTDPTMSDHTYWRLSDGQQFFDMDEITPEAMYDGSYDVTLVVTSPDGCIDSVTVDNFLTVLPKPNADFRWSPDPIMMFNTTAQFLDYSFGAVSHEWTFQEGNPGTSVSTNPTVVFPDGVPGNYLAQLIVTSDFGCKDTVEKIVTVMPEVLIYAPNAFTPDGDEFNQSWRVHLQGIDPSDFELLIYNRWGEIIWQSHDIDASWDGTYNGQIVPTGVYNWTIRTKDSINDGKYVWTGSINLIR